MQGAFRDLQRQLMETLPPAEKTAPIHNRATDWDESRDWCIAPSRTLTVAASQYEVQTHVTLSADRLADASIVGQVIENEIRNRELAIRAVYGQVLRDVEAAGPGPQ